MFDPWQECVRSLVSSYHFEVFAGRAGDVYWAAWATYTRWSRPAAAGDGPFLFLVPAVEYFRTQRILREDDCKSLKYFSFNDRWPVTIINIHWWIKIYFVNAQQVEPFVKMCPTHYSHSQSQSQSQTSVMPVARLLAKSVAATMRSKTAQYGQRASLTNW